MCGSDVFLFVIAILFPPVAVWIKRGICSADSLINLALCMLGFLPGLLHAWYIIIMYPETDYEPVADAEGQRPPPGGNSTVTYYYVQQSPRQRPREGSGLSGVSPGAPLARDAGYQSHPRMQGYGTVQPQKQFPGQQSGVVPSAQLGGTAVEDGAGGSAAPPPTYQQATGDHKIQHD